MSLTYCLLPLVASLLGAAIVPEVNSFSVVPARLLLQQARGVRNSFLSSRLCGSSNPPSDHSVELDTQLLQAETTNRQEETTDGQDERFLIRAPLKFIGPYPAMGLKFPNLATAFQREQNVSGIALDFVLDTAANVNTINAQVAAQLELTVVGQALPGVGSAGALMGGDTFYLGDAQLDGIAPELQHFTFLTNLTASALPVASPAAAGLLSLAFLQSFPAVDFYWGPRMQPATVEETKKNEQLPPSITFMDKVPKDMLHDRICVPIQRIPITQLPSITIKINGIYMPALLDTGSPVTVLNVQAAKRARIQTVLPFLQDETNTKIQFNPIAAVQNRLQLSQAAARGDILSIFGPGGMRVNLIKSAQAVAVTCAGSNEAEVVDFGEGTLFVGDLPGLAALNGLGVDSPPAVVLGMDVLSRKPNMLLRAMDNEVWF